MLVRRVSDGVFLSTVNSDISLGNAQAGVASGTHTQVNRLTFSRGVTEAGPSIRGFSFQPGDAPVVGVDIDEPTAKTLLSGPEHPWHLTPPALPRV